jgi:predicted CxxxxCH...CXXCH cytochrome family protein
MGGRVAWMGGAAAAAVIGLAGCGETRPVEAASSSVSAGCAGCHSAPDEAAPFRDQTGSTDPGRVTVGAHDAHLHPEADFGEPVLTTPIACAECHTVPRTVTDPGHLEDAPTDLQFGALARTGGAEPVYEDQGCSASYCHGNFPGGNRANVLRWVGGPANQAACGTCHGLPPQSGRHPEHVGVVFGGQPVNCNTCHGPVAPGSHLNGVKTVIIPQWDPQFAVCAQACHLPRAWRSELDQ